MKHITGPHSHFEKADVFVTCLNCLMYLHSIMCDFIPEQVLSTPKHCKICRSSSCVFVFLFSLEEGCFLLHLP